jgi:hypothetical protein
MKNSSEMNRRQFFKGVAAAALVPCLPEVFIPEAEGAGLKAMRFNPFSLEATQSLTQMILALMESEQIRSAIAGLSRARGFHLGMLSDAEVGESSGEFLTRLFGDGEWSDLRSPVEEIELEFARIDGRHRRVQEAAAGAALEAPAAAETWELVG